MKGKLIDKIDFVDSVENIINRQNLTLIMYKYVSFTTDILVHIIFSKLHTRVSKQQMQVSG